MSDSDKDEDWDEEESEEESKSESKTERKKPKRKKGCAPAEEVSRFEEAKGVKRSGTDVWYGESAASQNSID